MLLRELEPQRFCLKFESGEVFSCIEDTAKMHTSSLPLEKRLLSGLSARHSKNEGMSRTWLWFHYPQSVSASAWATVLFKTNCFLLAGCSPRGNIHQPGRSDSRNAPASHLIQSSSGKTCERAVTAILNWANAASLERSPCAPCLGLAFVVQLTWKKNLSEPLSPRVFKLHHYKES